MANSPYYVDPGYDYTSGLQGLQRGLIYRDIKQEKERKISENEENKKKMIAAKEAAIAAYRTNDPDKIAEAILKNPEIGEVLGELYDKRRDYAKEDYVSSLEKLLTEIETTGKLTPEATEAPETPLTKSFGSQTPYPSSIREKSIGKSDIVSKIYEKNPEAGKRMIEYEFAKSDPKRYKAWKEVYRQESKEPTPSSLKKLINERQALLDAGISENDPRVIAYNNKLWPEETETEVAPSNLRKLINEQAEFLRGGGDPESDIGKAYKNRILGSAANKVYSPSPLKKLINERQDYIEAGEAPDSPIIRAYNNKIAGIDIDIDELTAEEIDMWGAWLNVTGKMPSVGRGKQATKIRAAILKSAAKQAYEAYGLENPEKERATPSEAALNVVGKSADTKAIQSSLTFLDKQLSSMGSFIQNLEKQVDHVSELSEDLKTFDTRLLNVPLRALRGKIIGSALQAKYDMYLTEIEGEIGRLAYGATASIAELSASAQEKWAKIHDKNLSVKDMLSLLEETKYAANLRLQSVEDQLTRTRERMRTRDYGKSRTTGYPTINTQEEYNKLKSGDWYIDGETNEPARKR